MVAGFVKCFNDVAAGIVAPLKSVYDTIYNSLTNVWNFVKGIWDNIVNAFNDIMNKIPFIGGASTSSVPTYATGGYVPETGLALLHAGEYVVPAAQVSGGVPAVASGQTIIQQFSGSIVLPNVTNYDEFRAAMSRDIRLSQGYRGII